MPALTRLPAPLLWREVGLLAVVAGIVAWSHPYAATTGLLVLAWADSRARGARLVMLTACFGLGLALGWSARPAPLPDVVPSWCDGAVRVQGTVVAVRDLPDGRCRILLEGVRPFQRLAQISHTTPTPSSSLVAQPPPLTGRVALTWDAPTLTPLPGQLLTATVRIRPVRGFANPDSADFSAYWQRQGVAWTCWARGTRLEAELSGTPRVGSVWRQQLRDAVARHLWIPDGQGAPQPAFGPGAALIPALLFADQSALSTPVLDRVTRAGLRHSLALSGQHLAVVGLLALLPALLLMRLWPGVLLPLPRRVLIGVLSLPFAAACLWLGAAPPSLIRAALMLVIGVLLLRRGVPVTLSDGLCLALACMIAADPRCIEDLGVQLSFLAVAGMAVISPLLSHFTVREPVSDAHHHGASVGEYGSQSTLAGLWARSLRRPMPVWLHKTCTWLIWALGLSTAAWLATLPLVAQTFGRAPAGLVYNLIWLPALGLVVLPAAWAGLLLLILGWESSAGVLLHLAALPGNWLLDGLAQLDGAGLLTPALSLRPHWTAVLGYAALVASLAALVSVPSSSKSGHLFGRRLVVAGVVLSLVAVGLRLWEPDAVRLRVLDVGQGQAVLVEWPGGRALIDSGGFASLRLDSGRDIIAPILTANRPPRLQAVFASHMDRDHVGGLPFVLDNFTVGTFRTGPLAAVPPPREAKAANLGAASGGRPSLEERMRQYPAHTMVSGDRQELAPGLWLEALWPPRGHLLHGNDSLVLRLVHNGQGLALLPGDLEPREQRALLNLHPPDSLRAAVLVLPHHGSRRNLEPDLYAAVRPVVAVASAGAGNQWGLPADAVRTALTAYAIPLLETAHSGAITVVPQGNAHLEIKEHRMLIRRVVFWR